MLLHESSVLSMSQPTCSHYEAMKFLPSTSQYPDKLRLRDSNPFFFFFLNQSLQLLAYLNEHSHLATFLIKMGTCPPTEHVASTSNKMNTLHYLRESETITELIFSAFCIIFHNLSIKWLFALSAILISYFDLEAHSIEQQVKLGGCCMHQRSVPAAGTCFPPTSLPHPHTILRFVSQQHLREHLGSFQVNWMWRQKSPRTPRHPHHPWESIPQDTLELAPPKAPEMHAA